MAANTKLVSPPKVGLLDKTLFIIASMNPKWVIKINAYYKKKYGDVVRFSIPGMTDIYFVTNPWYMTHIQLSENDFQVAKTSAMTMLVHTVGEDNIALQLNERGLEKRKNYYTPVLCYDAINGYGAIMNEQIIQCMNDIQDSLSSGSKIINFTELNGILWVNVLNNLLLPGVQIEKKEIKKLIEALNSWGPKLVRAYFTFGSTKQLKELKQIISDYGLVLLNNYNSLSEDKKNNRGLIHFVANKLNQEQVIEYILSLITGGLIVPDWLTMAYHELGNNSRVLTKLNHEVETAQLGVAPSYAEIDKLKYLDACIWEVGRLWKGTNIFRFQAIHQAALGNYLIEPNIDILGFGHITNLDPQIWEKVTELYPERWLEKAENQPPLQIFGYGSRSCAGEFLTLAFVKMATFHFVRKFAFKSVTNPQPKGFPYTADRDILIEVKIKESNTNTVA